MHFNLNHLVLHFQPGVTITVKHSSVIPESKTEKVRLYVCQLSNTVFVWEDSSREQTMPNYVKFPQRSAMELLF